MSRSYLLVVGSTMALSYQLAHPVVAQGVSDHSNMQKDPAGRGTRTLAALAGIILGDRDEVRQIFEGVKRAHERVHGTISADTDPSQAGAPYAATDIDGRRWVFACFVHAIVDAHLAAVGPLTEELLHALWADFYKLGLAFRLAPHHLWATWEEFDRWYLSTLDQAVFSPRAPGPVGGLYVGKTARELTHFLFTSKYALWKVDEVIAFRLFRGEFVTLIPMEHTPSADRCGHALFRTLRCASAALPRTLLWSSAYRRAMKRVGRSVRSVPRDPCKGTYR